ncbi:MAG: hypothetical protein AAF211_29120, partial [Myxococcota bacterium]
DGGVGPHEARARRHGGQDVEGSDDAWRTVMKGAPSPTERFFYYGRGRLEAVRNARFKLMFDSPRRRPPVPRALFDLETDPSESTDVEPAHPNVVQELEDAAAEMRKELGDALTGTEGHAVRPVGRL